MVGLFSLIIRDRFFVSVRFEMTRWNHSLTTSHLQADIPPGFLMNVTLKVNVVTRSLANVFGFFVAVHSKVIAVSDFLMSEALFLTGCIDFEDAVHQFQIP